MFGIGGTELLLIAAVALLLLGPDKIPDVARKAGKILADFKRYQESLESVVRAEWEAGAKESKSDEAETPALNGGPHPTAFVDDEEDEEEEE